MSEKTEKATPHKLHKAKEQGQVSKSTELNTCILLMVLLLITMALWPSILAELKALIKHLLLTSSQIRFGVSSIVKLQQMLASRLITLWLPFALAGILAIVLSTTAQTGFVWSTKALAPDFKRLDISKGFKRLFSVKSLFEAGKSSLKLGLVTLLLMLSMRYEIPGLIHLINNNPTQIPARIMALVAKILLQLLSLLLALSVIDKLYTRWKFAKDQRMSKQELKDEYRQREGDPKIKAKIKQLQQQLRQKSASLEQVKTADVVITNPTHLAIALKYDRSIMPAPKVVCKAQGDMVIQVKKLAARHQVPLIENKVFARALFATCDLNKWIEREHFPVAAQIFRELYRSRAAV
ncbi:EscU/YscU/HrcU family type III secretion system export apparatus switch protein [Legionella sp. CNM-4043-24]|uniref:EscU/YscU/HrcU family type III secretion system export apparatus switch protein n=1 Tax=Legionella sp. CNM-4043-24 TaxID=3421646 RepID=UPI00403A7FD6